MVSQSPSLRGSGRFATVWRAPDGSVASQSPSLRGSGRFRHQIPPWLVSPEVSIPFIAGQWSLPLAARRGRARRTTSQSPSLRGSGRFR